MCKSVKPSENSNSSPSILRDLKVVFVPASGGKKFLSIRVKPEYKSCWETVRNEWLLQAINQNVVLDPTSKFEIWVFQNSRVDVDAYIKSIQDALQGIVYQNDKQVEKVIMEKWNKTGIEVTLKIFGIDD